MSERLIIFTVQPAATLREQDAADLEMLVAALEWRESAGLTGPDEFGPLSGNRWHSVLRVFLRREASTDRNSETAELEYLAKFLERDGTSMPATERRWADMLRRLIRDDYDVPKGRRKQDARDRLLSRHFWLLRRIYTDLSEDDCADSVAMIYADAGGRLSGSRVKRIAKTAQNRSAALQWSDDQVKAFSNHARTLSSVHSSLRSNRSQRTGRYWLRFLGKKSSNHQCGNAADFPHCVWLDA